MDEHGLAPHRRPEARQLIERSTLNLSRLLTLFDRAFDHRIDQRFQSASELREALGELPPSTEKRENSEAAAARIRKHLSTTRYRTALETKKRLESIHEHIRVLTDDIRREFGQGLEITWTGQVPPGDGTQWSRRGFFLSADPSREFAPVYRTVLTGTEIVLTVDAPNIPQMIIRIPADGDLSESDESRLRAYLIAGLDAIL